MQNLKTYICFLFILLGSKSFAIDYCQSYQQLIEKGVPRTPLEHAISFYKQNQAKLNLKKDLIMIADYSINSSKKRFFIVNLKDHSVISKKVSHGSGKITLYKDMKPGAKNQYVERLNGENGHNGEFHRCRISQDDLKRINKNRTTAGYAAIHNQQNLTRAGFFKTSNLYQSYKHAKGTKVSTVYWPSIKGDFNGLRLLGLTKGVNEKALHDGIVMHEASYNSNYAPVMGRSYGCPAFVPGELKKHIDLFTGGTLYYAYVPQCADEMKKTLASFNPSLDCSEKPRP